MLFLVAEASFHECGAKFSDDAPRCPRPVLLGLRPLAHEGSRDVPLRAVAAVVIVGVNGVRPNLPDFHAGKLLLVFDGLFQAYALVERLKGMVLDEGDTVYLYVVDLGAELDPLVFLPADDGADVRAVDAHDTVLDLFLVEEVGLLPVYRPDGCEALFLSGGQVDVRREAVAQRVPLASQLAQERKQPSKHFLGGLLLGLALFGIRQTGFGHVIELVARLLLLQRLAGGRHEGMQPVAAFPQQLDIRRIAEQAFVTGGVGQAAVKAGEAALPTAEEHTLHFLYVQYGGQTVADGADNLAVLQGLGGVDEHTAEQLHVQVPVEHFHKAVVRQPGVGTQEHQGHLPLDGEQGLASLWAPAQFGGNQPPHFL